MNFSGCTVNFYELPENIIQSEDVEYWIEEKTEHRLKDISYMTSPINEEIEVIYH
jgi:hypothetical protein